MGLLSKVVLKMLDSIEGMCATCGSKNVGFVDEGNCTAFKCLDCGSDEVVNISFSHYKKTFTVAHVKGARILRQT